ncbi:MULTISPECIES: DNA-3-methyladenine glycosylase I [Methyloversatilis]|jgi:DNA-3-methyladenine glycosylase I|uniref:DNA-3-methyladenine glycosylase I n=1 Tax=Methyloversatilis TaxID=378210 RepID=UPI0003614618|nr:MULTISPECIES: DNA-3-methyladenine glycosylase I [Methyloversatilis]MCR6666761.1 DNA-3-methyladenine glycosylase I [Methyloversatilis sp.]PZU52781.1 MAG: DNA-3-methyladenine glycosylase I [Thauera sp.]
MSAAPARCTWCGQDPLYVEYHDSEWGVPVRDERELFERLILEGAQAGLAWITILRKRDGYRRAFAGFDAQRIARYDEDDRARLMADAGIVRNRLKIDATIGNARALLALHERGGSLSDLLWDAVGGQPMVNHWRRLGDCPSSTPLSDQLSKELARLGFRFVGSTIVYAWMQSVGVVNDHLVDCFRHRELIRPLD